mmetsp:Transcript_26954/g.79359  ORF Transcript_26954/g.79359 Transcript_26954/m.79359 type:complete len:216 (-) Transcript_26954:957-1604(-)
MLYCLTADGRSAATSKVGERERASAIPGLWWELSRAGCGVSCVICTRAHRAHEQRLARTLPACRVAPLLRRGAPRKRAHPAPSLRRHDPESGRGTAGVSARAYTVCPCHVDPLPAVHPKQCVPVRIASLRSSSSDEMSKMVPEGRGSCGAPLASPPPPRDAMSSAMLKSQSYICPSWPTETRVRHMRWSTVETLNESTSSCMYAWSSPALCRWSA